MQTTAAASNLPAGNYTCIITDANGCSVTRNVTITQPAAALNASLASQNNVGCFGTNTGSASVNVTGGTPGYAYSWNTVPVQNTATATNLIASNYTCTITDANGCTTAQNVTVTQPAAALSAGITAQTNVLIFGQSTGSATVTASNGTAPYTYAWSNGQTATTATGLAAGNYSVTVVDANGCTVVVNVTITEPGSALTGTISSLTNVLCFGNSSGSASISASGGNAPYSYSWNTIPVQTTATATGLAAGTYTCTITDANGATTMATATIMQPTVLVASLSAQMNVACFGNASGSATAMASGGTPNYAYTWNTVPVQNTPTATGLPAGTWTCSITDANGCSTTVQATITQPSSALTAAIGTQTNLACHGIASGSATAVGNDGTAAYSYAWSDGQITATAVGLSAGVYACIITDANGCTASTNVTISQPAAALASTTAGVQQAVCGAANGAATANVTGGTTPYTYSWDSAPVQTTAVLSAVGAGFYTCTVTDANGCTATTTANITSPGGLSITLLGTTAQTCFGTANGQATVTASGGNAPYSFSWNTVPQQNSATASGLIAGNYIATVTDADGCASSLNANVAGPSAPLTLTLDTVTDVLCYGASTGAATVMANGGLAPYSISWNTVPAQSGATATGLQAGTWTATASDGFGCASSSTVTIDQPVAPLSASVDAQANVDCFGGATGYAELEVSGGSGAYTIAWNTVPVQNGSSATALVAGTYTATISDNNGCNQPLSVPVQITGPAAALAVSSTTSNYNGMGVACDGASDGTIDLTVGGGTAPYTYAWSGANGFTSNSADLNNLAAGAYTVTVSDANGCTMMHNVSISAPAPITTIANITTATCGGASNGAVDISVSGGIAPYTYAWSGPNGFSANSEDLSGIMAGVYSASITDANGCNTTIFENVNEPGLFTVSSTVSSYGTSNVSCAASTDGSIDVTVSGGTQPYTFQWNGPNSFTASTEDISGLVAGAYDLTITDANGCGTLEQNILLAPPVLFLSVLPTTYPSGSNISCDGATDGAIDATIGGGTVGFTISWIGPNGFTANTEDISGLAPGTYVLSVQDANGCAASQSVTLSSPSDLDVSLSVSQYNSGDAILCNGSSTGLVDLDISGGVAPYNVIWTGPNGFSSTDEDLASLLAGTYTALVTDAAGCDTTFSVVLTEPTVVTVTSLLSDHNGYGIGCNGGSDGSIDLTVSGGAGFYTYQWSGSFAFVSTAEDVSGLPAGQYEVIIADLNGCKTILSFTLTEPTPIAASATIITTSCQGTNNGAVDLTITGGVPPYSVQWSSSGGFGANTEDISNLFAGIYTATITDANGCTFSAPYDVNEPGLFQVSATATTYPGGYGVSCANATDGAIDLTATGGTPPIFYSWQGPNGFTAITEDISGLAAGTYDLTLTDGNGCTHLESWTLPSPTPINIGLAASQFADGSNVACTNGGNGSIDAIIVGGVAPYTIDWNGPNGFVSIDEDLTGLSAGTYTISVVDAIGCSASAFITLTQPTPIDVQVATSLFPSGGNVSCVGESDGSIDLTLSGGSLIYLISWTGPNGFTSNNQDISGLEAGTYNVTVTDANACTATSSVTLTGPMPIFIDLDVSQFGGGYSIGCNGAMGNIDATVLGGAIPWTYQWTGPNGFTSTAQDLIGVPVGTYDLLVTDAAGCMESASITLTEPVPVDMTATVSNAGNGYEIGCNGNDGAIDLNVSGGVGPYIFDWTADNGFASLDEDLTGLAAGNYSVTITDVNGCQLQADFQLEQAPVLVASVAITGNVCDGLDDGAVDLTLNGGVAPYTIAWNGPSGYSSTNEDITGLAGGLYLADITDANGCTAQQSATIAASQPYVFDLYVSDYGNFNIPCAGDSTGVIEVDLTGGTGALDIVWTGPNGFTANNITDFSGLVAGDYTVTITDANGCALDSTITLTEPSAPISGSLTAALYPSGTNISCNGASDGSIDLVISGGTAPYLFDWRGPDSVQFSTEDISGLVAGTYDLVVTDTNQCSFTTSITLTEPDSALAANVTLSQFAGGFNTSCDGNSDGSIGVSVIGGNGGNTFNWTGPNNFTSTADTLSGLVAGTYVLTVTDMNGCTTVQNITVTAPQPLDPLLAPFAYQSGSNTSCAGINDGSIDASLFGGVPSYTLNWTGPNNFSSSSATINGLEPGTYCLTVTDANNCVVQECVDVIANTVVNASATSTDANCGATTGAVDLSVNGGGAPYTFQWDTGAQTEDISGVIAGTYSVTITDANGCSINETATVVGSPAVDAEANTFNVPCNGGSDGSIDLSVIVGTGPYSYDWSNGDDTEDISDLDANDYTVTITDAMGCTWSGTWTIDESTPIQVDSTIIVQGNGYNVSSYNGHDGSIALDVTGGNAPYTYEWNTGASTSNVNGLAAGTYTVTITDANGCTLTLSFTLTQPTDLVMPTGFSPNQDGSNDAYVVQGLDGFPNNHMIVVNRWGNTVFDQLHYRNDWRGENQQGEALPNGTYFVTITINEGEQTLQNYVDLRR